MDVFAVAFGVILALGIVTSLSKPTTPPQVKTRPGWFFSTAYDVTDDAKNGKRSGLHIYVDRETGVQYVGTIFGGLTPRLDAQGQPMILKEKE